jgi:hypothetical protein
MSFDVHQYNMFNEIRNDGFKPITNNHYDHHQFVRRDSRHNRLKVPPQTINLDDLSENSSFSEDDDDDDLSSSHNAFCSTSDMTTSDSEIYSREAKLRYMDRQRMMK